MLDNFKKEKYCQERATGKSQRQAYLEAFPASKKWKSATVDNKASSLEKEDEISARLKELNVENAREAKLSRKKLLDRLEEIINLSEVEFKGSDIIKAVEVYAKMCGYEAVNDDKNIEEKLNRILDGIGGVI